MAHLHEKIDFTVEVFVVYRDKVLLRKHDKYKFWLSVGGHIEPDEDPQETAIREVKEEVGLDIQLTNDLLPFEKNTINYRELIPPKFMNRHSITDTHEHVTLSYFARSSTDKIIEGQENEKSEELKWFTMKDLLRNEEEIPENILYYAKQALEELL